MSENTKRIGIVVVAADDRATKCCISSAELAALSLKRKGYGVKRFFGESAYLLLPELQRLGRDERVCTGYVVGHGDLYRISGRRGVIIDENTCKEMAGAVLVLVACLPKEGLARRLGSGGYTLKACIGYVHLCDVIVLVRGRKSVVTEIQQEWDRCLVKPLDELLEGQTVAEATRSARRQWLDVGNVFGSNARIGKHGRRRIYFSFVWNGLALRHWGRGTCRLSAAG